MRNVGLELWDADHDLRIGTMVAANSGRPGGACGACDHSSGTAVGVARALHANHKTQEEDVVSNWLLTSAHNALAGAQTSNFCSQLFRKTLYRRWGLRNPTGHDCATLQLVDYTVAQPAQYADAWALRQVRLSRKGDGEYDMQSQYPTSLYFAAGPNVGVEGQSSESSTRRTYNATLAGDYDLFRRGVKAALRAALLAMALDGCDVTLLAGVSTGIYGGQHRERLRQEFEALANEVLVEPMCHSVSGDGPRSLSECFARVIWTRLPAAQPGA